MWLERLKRKVEAKGIEQVAKELGMSSTSIDLVLRGMYQASTHKVEARVKNIYGNGGYIHCPVLGDITPNICAEKWTLAKKIGMRAGNPETLKLYKTCLKCDLRKV